MTDRAQHMSRPPRHRSPSAVGVDLVSVAEVAESISAHGDRYLSRIYTVAELREARGRATALAVCFAAKEATLKALKRADEPIPWTAIEVRNDPNGGHRLELTGAAAELAATRGIGSLELSVSRASDRVAALVLAYGS